MKNGKLKSVRARRLVIAAVVFIFIIALAGALERALHDGTAARAASGDNMSGWAWSSNVGWLSFNCTNLGTCPASDYGVNLDTGTGDLSGYAWNDNIGWVSFNESELGNCPYGGGGGGGPNIVDTPVEFVRAGGITGTSFAFDIAPAGRNRLVVVIAGDESDITNLTGATVDGKACTLVTRANNTSSTGNHQEMWYCDEDNLGSSAGTVTVAIQGGDSSWATHALLFTGASQAGPVDSGINQTQLSGTTVSVSGIDVPANGLTVMGAGNDLSTSATWTGWTSPLDERTDSPDPTSANLGSASDIETSAQTGKTYTATASGTFTRATGVVGSWDHGTANVGDNIAPLASVTTNSETQTQGQTAVKAVDTIVDGWSSGLLNEWVTEDIGMPGGGGHVGGWIRLTWSSAQMIDEVVLYDRKSLTEHITAGRLTFSDGSTVSTGPLNNDGSATSFSFPQKTVTWVQFTVDAMAGGSSDVGLMEMQVMEVSGGGGGCKAWLDGPSQELRGWARACAGTLPGDCSASTDRTDGWEGWISLNCLDEQSGGTCGTADYGPVLAGNQFQGFSWGGFVMGWVDFDPTIGGGVVVGGPPVLVTLDALPTSVNVGGNSDLTWTITQGTPSSCTGSSVPAGLWSGSKNPAGGTETVFGITVPTTFTIMCQDAVTSDSDDAVVAINAANFTMSATPNQATMTFAGSDATSNPVTIRVNPVNGFSAAVALSGAPTTLPAAGGGTVPVTYTFSDPVLDASEYAAGSILEIYVPAPLASGSHTVTITGTAGFPRSTDITINVDNKDLLIEEF